VTLGPIGSHGSERLGLRLDRRQAVAHAPDNHAGPGDLHHVGRADGGPNLLPDGLRVTAQKAFAPLGCTRT
jgi:hypothetical protein